MKKIKKLLALVMSFAIIMSTVIVPASAAASNPADSDYIAPTGVNLFDQWGYSWDYDKSDSNKLTTLYGTAKSLNFTGKMPNASGATFTLSTLNSGNGGKGRQTSGTVSSTSYPCVQNVPVEPGSVYKFTVDVKLVDAATDTMVFANNNNTSKTRPKNITTVPMQQTANNSTWTTIEYYFEGESKTTSTSTQYTCHIGLYASNGGNFCVDNWTLTKIAAPAVTTVTPNDEATNVALNSDITVAFDIPVTLATQNVSISPAATIGAIVPSADSKSFTIPVSGQVNGTEYTVTLTNVKAAVGTKLDSYSFKYTTVAATDSGDGPDDDQDDNSNANNDPEDSDYIAPTGVNLFDEWGYSWDYDKDATNAKTTLYGNAKSLSFTGRMPSVSGATFEFITLNSGNGGKGRQTSGTISSTSYPCVQNVPVEADSVYKFTVDVKLVDAATDTMVFANNNNTSVTKPIIITTVPAQQTANNTGWTTIEFYFAGERKTTYTDAGAKTCHIGLYTSNGGNFCIDNWTLTKIGAPTFTSIPEHEDTNVDLNSDIILTFDMPVTLASQNVSISSAATLVTIIPSADRKTYTIPVSGQVYGTKYTVTLTNVQADIGTKIDSDSFEYTTVAAGVSSAASANRVGVITNITGDKVSGYQFEEIEGYASGSVKPNWGVSGSNVTLVYANEGGDHVVKISDRTYAETGLKCFSVEVESPKTYVVSAKVRMDTLPSGDSYSNARFKIGSEDGIASTPLALNEWVEIRADYVAPEGASAVDMTIKVGSNANAATYDYSIKDIKFVERPNAMKINSTVPSNQQTNVGVDTSAIYVNFSNALSDSIDIVNDHSTYFVIDGGAVISSAALSQDRRSVTLNLTGTPVPLKPDTTYNLTIRGIKDYIEESLADKTITFTTEPIFNIQTDFTFTAASGIDFKGVAKDDMPAPVLMYVIYRADGTTDVVSSDIGSADISYNTTFEATGGVSAPFTLAAGESAVAYMFKASDDLTLAKQPLCIGTTVATGTSEASAPENVEVITDPENNKIKVRGTSAPGSTVSVILIESASATNADNVSDYKGTANKRVYTVSEFTGTNVANDIVPLIKQIKHVVAQAPAVMTLGAEADVMGTFEIDLDVNLEANGIVYGIALSGDGITAASTLTGVYIPGTQELTDALNAINTASTAADMKTAIDTYGVALQLDLTTAVYGTDGSDIAKAILAKRSGNYTKESLMLMFNAVSAYCERQREALALLNTANNTGITQALNDFNDVLGYYEDASKLNYQAKYNQFGENGPFIVNQQLITMRSTTPFSSMNDFVTRFNSITPTVTPPQGGAPQGVTQNGSPSGSPQTSAPVGPGVSLSQPEVQPMFNDIADVDWAKGAIENLANRGIISGMGDGSFAPHANVTREQFVKMLVISFNISTASGSGFDDVDASAWYAPYIYGAYNAGIITGVSDNEFGTGASISRQDIITMIYRVMETLETLPEKTTDAWFEDEDTISTYAKAAVRTLADAGIINGVSDGVFAPNQNATRAQTAVILDRLFNTYLDVYFN